MALTHFDPSQIGKRMNLKMTEQEEKPKEAAADQAPVKD
jgi:hypothetical protein